MTHSPHWALAVVMGLTLFGFLMTLTLAGREGRRPTRTGSPARRSVIVLYLLVGVLALGGCVVAIVVAG